MKTARFSRWLLLLYPPSLRRTHGDEILFALSEAWRRRPQVRRRARLLADVAADAASSWTRPGGPPKLTSPDARRGWRWPGRLASDMRHARRLFAHSPWFAAGAIASLGLGIGSVTAIFSLADATLLRPFPFPSPDRVVHTRTAWSQPDYRDFVTRQQLLSVPAAWTNVSFGLERPGGDPRTLPGQAVSGTFFQMVGIPALAGRLLTVDDDRPGAPSVAVMSERLWQREFGADPSVLGSTIQLNRRPVTIVGIAPAAFRGVSLTSAPELFVPLAMLPAIGTGMHASRYDSRSSGWLLVGGRLRDGVTLEQASAEIEGILLQLHPLPPGATPKGPRGLATISGWTLASATETELGRFVVILLGATLVTLLLSCATVATLLMMRAERRQRELVVRVALGADRWAVGRMLLVESFAIGICGAFAGALLAALSLPMFGAFSLPGRVVIQDLQLALHPLALVLAMALGIATSLLFGLAPLWLGTRVARPAAIRGEARSTTRQRARSALVALQVAVCTLLLAGSFAFGRALRYGLDADLGFETDRAMLVSVDPQAARYSPEQVSDFQQRTLEALRAQPWVDAAGWTSMLPLQGRMTMGVKSEDRSKRLGDPRFGVDIALVSDGYFEALRIPLLSGRTFTAEDRDESQRVAVVNERLAKQAWPDHEAVGRTLTTDLNPAPVTIIGVVRNTRRGIDSAHETIVYLPAAQNAGAQSSVHLVVRPSASDIDALAATTGTLRRVDRLIAVSGTQTMSDHLRMILMPQRLGVMLFALFAGVAVTLTAFGLYGVVAYAVANRVREIGIRMALGAGARSIVRLVLRQGLATVLAGLAAGTVVCLWAGRVIAQFLFGGPPFGWWTVVSLAVSLTVVVLLALWVPARRALAIDPAAALRSE